ncbi:MAG: hypothetical protein A2284_14145 [Deltaproteobacteria bacterium RIFOXYA12_FULL_61_11]|nr:MAG: hypothetical protein A2284_14145 [Deltaproteobacteria bacterium RIFOXYA12_FULL_61_11]
MCAALLLATPGWGQDFDEYEDELILPTDEEAVNVVQKKRYLKRGKVEITPKGGIVVNDNFLKVNPVGLTFDIFFSEYWALELEGLYVITSKTSFTEYLEQDFDIVPEYNSQTWQGIGSLQWCPLYGKMSFLAGTIIPYDMFFTLGGGMVGTDSGAYPLGSFGFGQRFFLFPLLVLRFDLKFNYIKEKIQVLDPTTGNAIEGELRPNDKFDFGVFGGLSLFLPTF